MKCCNRVCTTPHCPYCGHAAATDPLSELARFVRGRRAATQRKVARHYPIPSGRELNQTQLEGRAKEVQDAERWAAWSDALDALILQTPKADPQRLLKENKELLTIVGNLREGQWLGFDNSNPPQLWTWQGEHTDGAEPVFRIPAAYAYSPEPVTKETP